MFATWWAGCDGHTEGGCEMGTHTYGELDVELSRELTEAEAEAWHATIKAGRQEPAPCGNTGHGGAPLTLTEPKELREAEGASGARVSLETSARYVCEHFDPTPGVGGFCYVDSDRFDPEGWDFTGQYDGDIGIAELGTKGFTIRTGGKVYDIVDAAAFFVESLPEGVTAEGSGQFESDGEHWAIAVRGRTVREVSAWVFVEGDAAPKGSEVWTLGHVNFVDGSVSLAVYSSEHDARVAYGDELREHLREDEPNLHTPEDLTNIGERVGVVPWVAHFVADGECLTYLDRQAVR